MKKKNTPTKKPNLITLTATEAIESTDKKVDKFAVGGHLMDAMLRREPPTMLDLWDSLDLDTATLKELKEAPIEKSAIVEGIDLPPHKRDIVFTLGRLSYNGYRTDLPIEALPDVGATRLVMYGDGSYKSEIETPILVITPYELAKENKGGKTPTGKDVENLEKAIRELEDEKFFIRTMEIQTYGARKIERYRIQRKPLIRATEEGVIYTDTDTGVEIKKRVLVITLNPIYIAQIEKDEKGKLIGKFVFLPVDIKQRTIEAYGSPRIPPELIKLRDYLAREVSSKRRESIISIDKLYKTIAPERMAKKKRRIGEIDKLLNKGLEVCKKMDLLKDWKFTTGAKGNKQIIFYLPKRWD